MPPTLEPQPYGVEILHTCDEPEADLVFVHGLRGHPQRTWTTESSPARRSVRKGSSSNPLNRLFSRSSGSPQYSRRREIFWPKHLLAQDIQNIRVMTFGYDAEISTALSRTANSSIFTVARDLVVRLQMKREDSGKPNVPIIFVAHSLGGIVVKDALKFSQDQAGFQDHLHSIYSNTYGVIFFGTPHRGSEIASLGHLAACIAGLGISKSDNRLLASLEQGSSELERIADSFSRMLPKNSKGLAVYSLQEGLPLTAISRKVVESYSSIIGDAFEGKSVIHADHREMCRFSDSENQDYQLVLGVVRRWVTLCSKGKGREVESLVTSLETITVVPSAKRQEVRVPDVSNTKDHIGNTGDTITLQASQQAPFILPQMPTRFFRGRDVEMAWIEESFRSEESVNGRQRISVLYGMGGVGKTQLALSYAYAHKNDYKGIFWITSTNELSVHYSFREIAQCLVDWAAASRASAVNFTRIAYEFGFAQCVDPATGEVKAPAGYDRAIIEAVRKWLSRDENTNWLLIFDSADDLEAVNLPQLFPNSPNGHILITSRQRHSTLLGRSLELQCLHLEDATELLIQYGNYESDQDKRYCGLIAKELGGLPLALVQGGSYLSFISMKPREYLNLYRAQKDRLLRNKPPASIWQYEYTVFTTWEISFTSVEQKFPVAAALLLLCGFLQAEDIPYSIFALATRTDGMRGLQWRGQWHATEKQTAKVKRWIGSLSSRSKLDEVLSGIPVIDQLFEKDFDFEASMQALFELSLISENTTGDGIAMHPLINAWCQYRRPFQDHYRYRNYAIIVIARALDQTTGNTGEWDRWCQHLEACTNSIHQLKKNDGITPDDPNVLHALDVIGKALEDRQNSHATFVYELLHHLLESGRGPANALTLGAQDRLASTMDGQDSSEESRLAGLIHEKNANESLKYLGAQNPDTQTAFHNFGAWLLLQRRYCEAEKILKDVVDYRSSQSSSTETGLLKTKHNLALSIAGQLRYEDAEGLLQDVLAKLFESESPQTNFICQVHSGLTLIYCAQSRWEEAEKYLVDAVAISEARLGLSHFYTLEWLLNLALFYTGEVEDNVLDIPHGPCQVSKARETYRILFDAYRQVGRPWKMSSVTPFNAFLWDIGGSEEAMAFLSQTIDFLATAPDDDINKFNEAEVLTQLGTAQWDCGLFENAIESYDSALRLLSQVSDVKEATRRTIPTRANRAVALRDSGKLAESEQQLREILECERKGDGPANDFLTSTNLASVLAAQGRHSEALELYESTQKIMMETLGHPNRQTLLNKHGMACLEEKMGNGKVAVEMLETTFDEKAGALGMEQTATMKTALTLGRLYRKYGRDSDARKLADTIRPFLEYA